MTDSYGDGWTGNSLDIYEDGVWMTSLSNENIANGFFTPETESVTYCPGTGSFTIAFMDGQYTDEVSFGIYYDDGGAGILIGEGYGQEPSTLVFENINYASGDVLYGELWGSDADDNDATIY